MIALTGATGQLGHYVLQDLLNTVPASQIVAIVRNPAKAQALSQQGVVVRQADYSDEAALTAAEGRRARAEAAETTARTARATAEGEAGALAHAAGQLRGQIEQAALEQRVVDRRAIVQMQITGVQPLPQLGTCDFGGGARG